MSNTEDQKTVVVEKRLSRGVIRRRSRNVSAQQAEKIVEESKKKAVLKAEEQAQKKAEEKSAAIASKKTPQEIKKTQLTLDESAKEKASKNVKKNLAKVEEEKAPVKKVVTKETVTIKEEKEEKEEPKKERKKVLKFKDRIKGQIDLDKIHPKKPKPQEAAEPRENKFQDSPDKKPLKDDPSANRKTIRKKGVKSYGGDLDIEGMGRTTNLSQLVRTASGSDRVFQPNLASTGRPIHRKKKIISRKGLKSTTITEKKASKRVIEVNNAISVGNLAQELGVKSGEIIKKLMELGVMATINQDIDKDTATLIATEYKYEVKDVAFKEEALLAPGTEKEEDLEGAPTRPPIVTIMGHVDHGKTSLLDAIRKTNVTEGEAGGITQHIGAYTVTLDSGDITFLDTPGHAAFTTMRSRGAQVTDIVILVVAADDGIMPQTEESIDHARAASVPIVVAVNKCDKEQADPERVKRQLSEKNLVPEEWGGDVIFNEVSAKSGNGIKELLENVLLQAEVLELKAHKEQRAKGIILEAKLDRQKGPLGTLLVQSGTLNAGEYVVAGTHVGKIRAMHDWKGQVLETAGPSTAVEILGLEGVPEAGDVFDVVESDQDARKVAEHRIEEKRIKDQNTHGGVSLEDMFSKMKSGEMTELNIILKADVQGSLEAVRDAVMKIGNEEVQAKIIHSAVGGVNESDIRLALASEAVIIGFNVRPETKAIHLAKEQKVDVKLYKIIYDLVNDVKLAMQGLLEPDIKEVYLGRAEVRQAFAVSKVGTIAGSMVVDGVITRNCKLRLLRDNAVIYEGDITSLKRFKDDAKDVKQGFECGIGISGYNDIKEGDVIEAYKLEEIQKSL